MKKYALVGERLGHSYSPFVHKQIYKDLHIEADFSLLECKREELGDVINLLRRGIYQGFNVTFHYKLEVMQCLRACGRRCPQAGRPVFSPGSIDFP